MIGSLDGVSAFNDVKCAVARSLPSMIPIRAACFQRVPWIVGGRYRYLAHLASYLTHTPALFVLRRCLCFRLRGRMWFATLLTVDWQHFYLAVCLNSFSCHFVAVDPVACLVSWLTVCKSRGLGLGLSPKHQCRRRPMTHADCLRQQFPEQSGFS